MTLVISREKYALHIMDQVNNNVVCRKNILLQTIHHRATKQKKTPLNFSPLHILIYEKVHQPNFTLNPLYFVGRMNKRNNWLSDRNMTLIRWRVFQPEIHKAGLKGTWG